MAMRNFGRNVDINPTAKYTPKSEAEVLEIMNRHRGQQIRCVGRIHSWSRILEAEAVLPDLRERNEGRSHVMDDEPVVHVDAGC